MVSRQNGRFTKNVLSALAAVVALAVPSVALAEAPANGSSSDSSAPAADKAKPEKHAKKSHVVKGQKAHAKPDAHAATANAGDKKPAEPTLAKVEAKNDRAAPKGKKTKKTTASRNAAGKKKATAKKGDSDSPRRRGGSSEARSKPCFGKTVAIDRAGLEGDNFALVDCKGTALEAAREKLSVLARPWGAAKPSTLPTAAERREAEKKGTEIRAGVRLVDPGLVSRLEAVAKKFPNKTLSLVSGYRPQSRGSLHQRARAIDVRVTGVPNEELVAFCKTLTDTGCGYYPNSSFVHMDVRSPGSGNVTWIDASGPGEAPHYVTQWPMPADAADAKTTGEEEPHDDVEKRVEDDIYSDATEDEPVKSVQRTHRGSSGGMDQR